MENHKNENNIKTSKKKKKYHTIDDLKEHLYFYPCSKTRKGYISLSKERLLNMIRDDFFGEKHFNKKTIHKEVPKIWGLTNEPYPKKVEKFVLKKKAWTGGRKLIVMNTPYFENAYWAIEDRYWHYHKDDLKTDTRYKISDTISKSVITKNEDELSHVIEQILNTFLSKLNKKIESSNDVFKVIRSRFVFYLSFYNSPYVQRCIEKPEELLCSLNKQKEILQNGLKPLYVSQKKLNKFINKAIQLLSEENYSDKEKIDTIVDRIYSRERDLIRRFCIIDADFKDIEAKAYQLENAIRIKTEELLKSSEKVYPNSVIIDHARNNGLIKSF